MLYFEKNCEVLYFRSLTLVSESTPKIISIRPLITEKRPFKNLKILSVLTRFISKINKVDIFNFLSVKYFGKRFFFLKIRNVMVNYCGNYRLSNLLFYLTGHNSCKLTSTLFWKAVSKGVSGRSFKIFGSVTVKWRPVEMFVKLNGKDLFFVPCANFRKSKTCIFTEIYNFD